MLDILRLPMPKETLAKMTPEERSLFLLLGYASNQVNVLWKLVIIATNNTPNDSIEQRVSGAQTQIFSPAHHWRHVGSVALGGAQISEKHNRTGLCAAARHAIAGSVRPSQKAFCVESHFHNPKQLCVPSPDERANGSSVSDGRRQQGQ